MKRNCKIPLLVIFLLLGGFFSFGQTGTLYEYAITGKENIIRFDQISQKHIIYTYVSGYQNHFSMTDFNNTIDVRICDNLNVTDFEIIDRFVFFCGNDGIGSGFIGWYHIDSLFSLLSNVHIDFSLSASGLQTLDNIELYHDASGNICIAGYGIHSSPYAYSTSYRAFEAVGTPMTGMQYRTMDLYYSGWYENVSDMAVTDNFVVYVSDMRNQVCPDHVGIGIFLHTFPKYNQFGLFPNYLHAYQLTTISSSYPGYVLPIVDDPYCIPNTTKSKPQVVHSANDIVAVCTYRKNLNDAVWNPPVLNDTVNPCGIPVPLPPVQSFITNIQFDLSALVSGLNNPMPMISYDIAELPNNKLIGIDDLLYDPSTMKYIVLHRHERAPLLDEHAVTMFDYSTGATAAFVDSYYQSAYSTHTDWFPTSICLGRSPNYTLIGYKSSIIKNILWRSTTMPPGNLCEVNVQYPVTHLPLLSEKTETNWADPSPWKSLYFLPKNVTDYQKVPCTIICN